jgi:NAD+ diphosphatase
MRQASFVSATHDRIASCRNDPAWLARERANPLNRLIAFLEERPLLRIVESSAELVTIGVAAHDGELVLIGRDDRDRLLFAAEIDRDSELAGTAAAIDLRSVALQGLLPEPELAQLAQARSLLAWHARNGFCANCGVRSILEDAGYRRRCPACQANHFPRTDPVAIMIVHHGKSLLLGRQPTFQPGMYSALAGFIEPGETIEDAARREIFEESGIRVGAVRYVASQPWPFPSSLMIGLIGEALTTEIAIDRDELEDVRWFDAPEVIAMLERRHPDGLSLPMPFAIAHHLVLAALAQPPASPNDAAISAR